ncbi:ectoine/hydroxyectoine ABC transporter permease subunit EhuD [Acidocella aminolytica]|jgi:polar amino acid transport system permease protein|uniref:ABC transporter polar amino acid permease inner membrane subunit n=1 Tax=Acidocella aminolytica 101 = DSM 11237 TaxID=1120923 RepID=A0A0D6PB02_9PROT|nr:ectoine/hydroxyectoine ABC transporter permease subunit EhuD [Acidocella aminolytica]GAN78832.1 ABC transporter polar amino acid permease inner membrane subunit [Acidocella aminolytica 101 = DSM 11237]SHF17570.1 amino acid ABC transporter membrane protein 2, PAAT family (TC 3.A.1.3.-) [Acidocella aminolytica 101 = DSM 11237]
MMYGFHWDLSNPLAFAWSILPIILIGLTVTVEATILGFIVSLIIGLALALLRRTHTRWVAWPTAVVIEFIRDTPLIVQLFFLYYVLPQFGILLPAFLTGALALGIQYSAYMSEVYRAGLDAVPHGQLEAATALNLSRTRMYVSIIIPQAIPRILPAMGNYLVSMIKDTPVLSVVTVLEMLGLARIIGDRTFRYLVPLTLVGAIFLILSMTASAGVRRLERALPKSGILLR